MCVVDNDYKNSATPVPSRILVVENNEEVLDTINSTLASGYELSVCRTFDSAVKLLTEGLVPNIAIIGNCEGTITAKEMVKFLKNSYNYFVYAILLTEKNKLDGTIKGIDYGADEFLIYPLDKELLSIKARIGAKIGKEVSSKFHLTHSNIHEVMYSMPSILITLNKDADVTAVVKGKYYNTPHLSNITVGSNIFSYFCEQKTKDKVHAAVEKVLKERVVVSVVGHCAEYDEYYEIKVSPLNGTSAIMTVSDLPEEYKKTAKMLDGFIKDLKDLGTKRKWNG